MCPSSPPTNYECQQRDLKSSHRTGRYLSLTVINLILVGGSWTKAEWACCIDISRANFSPRASPSITLVYFIVLLLYCYHNYGKILPPPLTSLIINYNQGLTLIAFFLQTKPEVVRLAVLSKIMSRFASTEVRSKLKNLDWKAAEAKFTISLPEDAFISAFSM